MPKHFQVILNPIAGAGLALTLVDALAARLTGLGHRVDVYRTRAAGDASDFASRLIDTDLDALLVAGGDGTISEVIDGLAAPGGPLTNGKHPPLAILPVGTENLLGKVIGARADIAQAEGTLLAGAAMAFDVGHVGRPADEAGPWNAGSGPVSKSGHFVMVAGAGFDAEVVHRLALTRTGNISYLNYFMPLLSTFLRYGFPAMRIEADGELLCEEPALAFVGNIPRYAMGLPICRRAKMDDGLLDLVVFRCSHRRQLLLHSVRTIFGRHLKHPAVIYRQVKRAVIRSNRPVALEIDGDDGGQLPVEFSMPGRQVHLLLPPKKC